MQIVLENHQLEKLDGEKLALKELILNDKINLLVFYHTDCVGCTGRALPFGYELSKEIPELNMIVVHANFSSRKISTEDVLAVFTDGNAPFPIYQDHDAKLYEALDCDGTPHWIFMDVDGTVSHSIFGSQDGSQMKIHYAIQEKLEGES